MDIVQAYNKIELKARKGYVRFHTETPRRTCIVAKILQRYSLLQECKSFLAPEGEVFAYASQEGFSCQAPLWKFIKLSQSRYAKYLLVSVFKPEVVTCHDDWQVSFNPSKAETLVSYRLVDLVFTEEDED